MLKITALGPISWLPLKPQELLAQMPHESQEIAGWTGLATWTLKAEDGSLWDLDWRYAFGQEIFKQHWIDFGWDEAKLLHRRKRNDPVRNKLILYICAEGMNVPTHYSGFQGTEHDGFSGKMEGHYGIRFRSVTSSESTGKPSIEVSSLSQLPTELHLLLPSTPQPYRKVPFGDFATTRTLKDTPPEIINNPEDEVQTVLFMPEREGRQGKEDSGRRRCTNFPNLSNNRWSPSSRSFVTTCRCWSKQCNP